MKSEIRRMHRIMKKLEGDKMDKKIRICIEGEKEYKEALQIIREDSKATLETVRQLNECLDKLVELRNQLFA